MRFFLSKQYLNKNVDLIPKNNSCVMKTLPVFIPLKKQKLEMGPMMNIGARSRAVSRLALVTLSVSLYNRTNIRITNTAAKPKKENVLAFFTVQIKTILDSFYKSQLTDLPFFILLSLGDLNSKRYKRDPQKVEEGPDEYAEMDSMPQKHKAKTHS